MTTRLDKCDLSPVKTGREKVIAWAYVETGLHGDYLDVAFGDLYDIGALSIPEDKK